MRLQAVKVGERGLRQGTERKVLGCASTMAISRNKDRGYMKELAPECSSVSHQITSVLARSLHKNDEESLTQSSQHLHQGSHWNTQAKGMGEMVRIQYALKASGMCLNYGMCGRGGG